MKSHKKQSYENRIELLQGTLDLLILQTLQWGPRHGYGIKKWIKSEWTTSENNQKVKTYQLTTAGKKQLAAERSNWERLTAAMAGILNPTEEA